LRPSGRLGIDDAIVDLPTANIVAIVNSKASLGGALVVSDQKFGNLVLHCEEKAQPKPNQY